MTTFEWQPIETAPGTSRNGRRVDIWCICEGEGRRFTDCFYNMRDETWDVDEFPVTGLWIATHWTPIPAPPK
jgi:hypothetical protein